MFACWQEYINDFKSSIYANRKNIIRLPITEEELETFWDNLTLIEMEQLFTIADHYINNYLLQIVSEYLPLRKHPQDTYIACYNDSKTSEYPLMYVYDCKLFRGTIYSKE